MLKRKSSLRLPESVHVPQRSYWRKCPRLGQLNRRQAAALAGLAPFNHDSGSLRGRRAIFGGRPALRSGLYMAALAAARYNPILSRFYQPLRARGKLHQLALTAVMRKLLLALNHTLKSLPCTT